MFLKVRSLAYLNEIDTDPGPGGSLIHNITLNSNTIPSAHLRVVIQDEVETEYGILQARTEDKTTFLQVFQCKNCWTSVTLYEEQQCLFR